MVKKKILRLLDVGVIFSDSMQVSVIHVVPKNSGITVVKNAEDQMISTRVHIIWGVFVGCMKLNIAT